MGELASSEKLRAGALPLIVSGDEASLILGVLRPLDIRLAGGATLTEELVDSERCMLLRKGRKLDVICLDCGGAGGSAATLGRLSKVDEDGESVGVRIPGPFDDLTDCPVNIDSCAVSRGSLGVSVPKDIGGGPVDEGASVAEGPKKLSKAL